MSRSMMPSTEDAAGGRGGLSGVAPAPAPAPRGSPAGVRRGWRKERMDCCCRRGCIAVAGRWSPAVAGEAGQREGNGREEARGRMEMKLFGGNLRAGNGSARPRSEFPPFLSLLFLNISSLSLSRFLVSRL
jgi:hypothetical protein